MSRNPIEANPVTRFLLGLAVVLGMSASAHVVVHLFAAIGVPYPAWTGTGVGAVVAFAAFAAWYTRYDESAPRVPDPKAT